MKKFLYFSLFVTAIAVPNAFGYMNQHEKGQIQPEEIPGLVPEQQNLPAHYVPGVVDEQIAEDKVPGQHHEPAVEEEKQPEPQPAVPAVRPDFNFQAEHEVVASGDESSFCQCLLCCCCFFSCSKSSKRVAPAPMHAARHAYEVPAAVVRAAHAARGHGQSVGLFAGAEAYRYGPSVYEGFEELTFSQENNMSPEDIVRIAKGHPSVVKLVLNRTGIKDEDLKEIGTRCQVVAVLGITGCSKVVDIRQIFQKGSAAFPYVLVIQCNDRSDEDKEYIKDFVEYNKHRLVNEYREAMCTVDQEKINFLKPVIDFAIKHSLIR